MQHYNFNRIKSKRSYSMTEISSLLGIDRKTCRRWIKNEGLKVVCENVSPLLVMGAVLIDFIKTKLMETSQDTAVEPMVEPAVKPDTKPSTPSPVPAPSPSRRDRPFLPMPNTQPDPKASK